MRVFSPQSIFNIKKPFKILAIAALAWLAIYGYRLNFPARVYYDEVKYIQSAREILAGRVNSWGESILRSAPP